MPSVYDIMVDLNLNDNLSEGLKDISESFAKIAEQVEALRGGLSALNGAILGGAGLGIIYGLDKIAGANDKLTHSLTQMALAGKDAEAALMSAKRATDAVPGTNKLQNLEILRQLGPILGEQTAYGLSPDLVRMDYLYRQFGISREQGIEPAARMARKRGLQGESAFEFMEAQRRTTFATEGQVTPAMLERITRQAGISGLQWSDEFLMNRLPALLMQEGGGGRWGAQLGRLSSGMEAGGKHGQFAGLRMQGVREIITGRSGLGMGFDKDLFERDPYEWSKRIAEPWAEKFGDNPDILLRNLKRIFTNPIMAELVAVMMQGVWAGNRGGVNPFEDMARQRAAVYDPTDAMHRLSDDPQVQMERLRNNFNRLLTTVSDVTAPERTERLKYWNDQLDRLNVWIGKQDKDTIQAFTTALEMVGKALIAAGAIAIAGSLLGTPAAIVVAATAVGLALYQFGLIDTDKAKTAAENLVYLGKLMLQMAQGIKDAYDILPAWAKQGIGIVRRGMGFVTPGEIIDPISKVTPERVDTAIDFAKRMGRGVRDMMFPNNEPTFATIAAPMGDIPLPRPRPSDLGLGEHHANIVTQGLSEALGKPPAFDDSFASLSRANNIPLWAQSVGLGARSTPPTVVEERWPVMPAPQSPQAMPGFSPSTPAASPNANVNVQLNLDGRSMGQVLLERILSMYDFAQTGGSANWNTGFPTPDTSYTAR